MEKGIRVKDYAASRLDVIVGSLFTDIVAWFIVVACAATLFVHGMGAIQVAADAAEAMRPLAGDYAFILFAFGLFNASLFAASILPLSTAYTVCEGLGLESGVDKSFKEAPFFYWLYTLLIAGGALTVLVLPDAQLINFAILSQVLNGVLLPVVIILMLLLINRTDLMGEHKNSRALELDRLGHQHHRDRHDACDAVGDDAGQMTVQLKAISEQLPVRQVANQPAVGGQEVEGRELFELGPAHLVIDAVLHLAAELVHGEKLQVDCAAMAIVVPNMGDTRPDHRLDAQLFFQFAGQRLFRALASLDLAAGKLPVRSHGLVRPPLADQNFAAAHNQRRRNKAQGGTCWAR